LAVDRVVWRRRRPRRAAGRLVWTLFVAVVVTAPLWLMFSGEPLQAADGALNPLALLGPGVAVIFLVGVLAQVTALVRRPLIEFDYFALTVRSGLARTLVLPWAQLTELVVLDLEGDEFLLIRCQPHRRGTGDRPRRLDQGALRSLRRRATFASGYDLAVPMDRFAGTTDGLLAEMATRAPAHVILARRAAFTTRRSAEPLA
jgi:hypothetical protein